MKKTLVALAVLAASGASFAQVTLSGNFTTGYQAATNGAGANSAGLGVDTSQIDFTATEDLGGGMKATAKMALAGADRSGESGSATPNGPVTGRNASLALQTNVGVFTLATTRAPDYLSGVAGLDAYYSGFDGKIYSSRTSRDLVAYTLPMGALTLSASYQESGNILGIGAGTDGVQTTTGQRLTTVGATYAAGKAVANFTYLMFDAQNMGIKNQTRLSGNYDLGMVKIGAGVVLSNWDNGPAAAPKVTDTMVGLTAPLGALTLGAQFAQRRFDDAAGYTPWTSPAAVTAANGTKSGYSLQATYALSKRTAVIGNYARWDQTVGAANASSQYQMLVSHSF